MIPNQDDEIFEGGYANWNITKLRCHLKDRHFQIYSLNKEQYEKLITNDQKIVESKIDHVDLSEPIIVAKFKDDLHLVIDGLHRLRKAKNNNEENIYAYIVPKEVHKCFTVGTVYFE
jgi:hypothetical protein